ncbi:MAG: hypothetical protein HY700_08675 [Gemmatimonadetes bacterium]|nr:hypothetical protein [Gemmatimonadota bacterium]
MRATPLVLLIVTGLTSRGLDAQVDSARVKDWISSGLRFPRAIVRPTPGGGP